MRTLFYLHRKAAQERSAYCDYASSRRCPSDSLPASRPALWKGHVSLRSVADKVGVGSFWQRGSRLPALIALLEGTLEFRRDRFGPLVIEIVRVSLTYCQKNEKPVMPEEIEKINGLVLEVGFKFPELWDPSFSAVLAIDGGTRAKRNTEQALLQERLLVSEKSRRSQELEELKGEFIDLCRPSDRQGAGIELEKVLDRLFALHELAPRKAA